MPTSRAWTTRPLVLLPLALAAVAGACGSDNEAPGNGAAGGPSDAGEGNGSTPGGAPAGGSGGTSAGESGSGAVDPTGGTPSEGGAGGADAVDNECEPGATRACYDGAPATKDVAPCKGGTSTCNARGVWGACVGQVLPVAEVCADGLDNDCNGVADDILDVDGDGWTACEGDCCEVVGADCAVPSLVNPSAIDVRHVASSGAVTFTDDDCSGTAGDSRAACDDDLALGDVLSASAAAAVDVCRSVTQDARSWGLVTAKYVTANGMQIGPGNQAGLEATFGTQVAPQQGERMLLLSTGRARTPTQTNACGSNSCNNDRSGTAPAEFPTPISGCPVVKGIHDDIAFEMKLRAPSNATGFRFSYRYWAFATPGECSAYMDEFIALVTPPPQGSSNGNITLDSTGTPISPKSGLFSGSSAPLQGTGFDTWTIASDPGGATSWLTSSAPVKGGAEVTVRFAIWDGGDPVMDSSVLIDDFEWLTESGVQVGTAVIAAPKSQ